MKYNKLSRRHFLQGMGGFALSMPFLPSLMPKDALAENPPSAPFLIFLSTEHGGLHPQYWYPNTDGIQWSASEQQTLYSGSEIEGLNHTIRQRRLSSMLNNGRVSDVLGNSFTPHIESMNLIRGLDIMFGGGHHAGGHLGNFHGNDQADPVSGVDANLLLPPMPTIDNILAESSNFYGAGDPMTIPVMNLGYHYKSPSYRRVNGRVQVSHTGWGLQTIFDQLFGRNFFSGNSSANSGPLLNRIMEDYRRLRSPVASSGRRISREDSQVVEQHLTQVSDLERRVANLDRLSASSGDVTASCSTVGLSGASYGPSRSEEDDIAFWAPSRRLYAEQWSAYTSLMATAINCGLCRIFTISLGSPTDYGGDFHQEVAHLWNTDQAQVHIREAHSYLADNFVLPLVRRLNDVQNSSSQPLLNNGLVMWQHESWYQTHTALSLPTVTFGSAGGRLNTGLYVDYRNLSSRAVQNDAYDWRTDSIDPNHPVALLHPGIPINRWLHTLLEVMGISEAEYRAAAGLSSGQIMHGYGDHATTWYDSLTLTNRVGNQSARVTHRAWPQRVLDDCNQALPFLRA